ncbi:MAG: PKD domain-containing protein [Flavobacteriales bacterium]|nr:PKD domain-containing protein [Flavobacteriales bacterium]
MKNTNNSNKRARFISFSALLFTLSLSSCFKQPTACFEPSSTNVKVGQTVQFTNCSENSNDFEWDFGDGAVSSSENPSHTYSSAGSYTVSLDANAKRGGDWDEAVSTITVTADSNDDDNNNNGNGGNGNGNDNPSDKFDAIYSVDETVMTAGGNAFKSYLVDVETFGANKVKVTEMVLNELVDVVAEVSGDSLYINTQLLTWQTDPDYQYEIEGIGVLEVDQLTINYTIKEYYLGVYTGFSGTGEWIGID